MSTIDPSHDPSNYTNVRSPMSEQKKSYIGRLWSNRECNAEATPKTKHVGLSISNIIERCFSTNICASHNLDLSDQEKAKANAIFDRYESNLSSATSRENLCYCDPWMHDFSKSKQFDELKTILEKLVFLIPSQGDTLDDIEDKYKVMLHTIKNLISSFKPLIREWAMANKTTTPELTSDECLELTVLLVGKSRLAQLINDDFIAHLTRARSHEGNPHVGMENYCAATLEAAIQIIKDEPNFYD